MQAVSLRMWKEWIVIQQQQAANQQCLFQLMADQKKAMLDQMATTQMQANKQLGEVAKVEDGPPAEGIILVTIDSR